MADHRSWCLDLDPHDPSEGCEAELGGVNNERIFVAVGILLGVVNVAMEVRNPELVADLPPEDVAALAAVFTRAYRMVTVPDGGGMCPFCAAVEVDGRVDHREGCRLADWQLCP